MPNHVHGTIVVTSEYENLAKPNVGARHASPLPARNGSNGLRYCSKARPRGARLGSPGAIVESLKSAAARRINELRHSPGASVWQRNYYQHIVRDEDEMRRIRQNIAENPARWAEDNENPVKGI